jgi:broad specificity phosphatase PhoE
VSSEGPYRLVVLRHGQSEWNAAGLFTGWTPWAVSTWIRTRPGPRLKPSGTRAARQRHGTPSHRQDHLNSRPDNQPPRIVVSVDGFE